jgi:very-short-patch-repair endonuclease
VTDSQTLSLASAVARYHAGCLRVIGAQNVAQTDVRTAKKAAYPCDLGQLVAREELMRYRQTSVLAPDPPAVASPVERERGQRLAVWERLRELAVKAAVEGHQKEVVYAGPLLSGVLWAKNVSTRAPVLAPLFLQTATIEAQPDGSMVIEATDEPPRFNTSLWANAFQRTEADQIVTLGIDAQADLAEGWDDDRVHELLHGIRSIFPGLALAEVDDRLQPWPERPTPARAAELQPYLGVHLGAALYLANKSSPYLLADLDRIAGTPAGFLRDERPLSVLLRAPADEVRPELEQLDIHEVVFPFPSNGPQRRVVDAVDKNRIVVVQGPPGNGKSLTIANLAAHLVAEGKSVLVCSHKEQALAVVRDKLDELKLPFLYASMVGTSASAKRGLQGQIQDVRGFFGKVNQHLLRRQLKEVTERRRRNGERYQELRDDFNERAEAEQAEAEALLLSIEAVALLPGGDPIVAETDRERVARELVRLDDLARKHRSVWPELCATEIARETTTGSRQAALMRFLELQTARLDAASDREVQDLVRRWQPVAEREPGQVDAAKKAGRAVRQALRAPVAAVDDDPDPARVRALARALAANADLLADARQAIERLSAALARARELQDARNHLKVDVARRQQVMAYHAQLASLLKRKGARRWLGEHAPGATDLQGAEVQAWAAFWDAWARVQDECDALGGELRLAVPERYDPAVITTYLARLRRSVAVAEAVETARAAGRQQTTLRLPLDPLITELTQEAVDLYSERWERALAAVGADRAGNQQLRNEAALAWLGGRLHELDTAVDRERYDDARRRLYGLRRTLDALPALAERAQILQGPTGALTETVQAIEAAAARNEPAAPFLVDLEAAFDAQPTTYRIEEIRSAESTRELAEELNALRDTILADARQYLSLRIQRRIYEGFRRPKFNASLERFRKAISTSAKRFDRIEELKNALDFDVDVLTEVFPCWIMRPEDACRMFPLRHDIFDVVVFDEASQCNPDQTLPIFARAGHAVVFGDENQLSNEDLKRSFASDANKALLRQSGLIELDPSGLFDQTENSLLGLVSYRDQAPIVLNEHFRCRPELVAFSNNRFYSDGLRIMRDAEDDRGLGPAMLIYELKGVPPLGRSKVNISEAELLVEELCRLLQDRRYDGLSIGVLSLFREQIEHIESLVEQRVSKEVREHRRLICSTVDGFQGDERDVILYSWRYSTSQSPSILAFTNGKTGDQRVNVALTRARHQAIHFISAPVHRFPGSGNVGQFLQHAVAPARLVRVIESRAHQEPITEARRRAARTLRDRGLGVTQQFVACGVGVDLVAHDRETWARVAVFIDGALDPEPPPTADRRVDAQGLLERAGWTVERILSEEAVSDAERLLARVRGALQRCGPRDRPDLDAEHYFARDVGSVPQDMASRAVVVGAATSIAREDSADYHWPAPSVEARRASGEDVFQSDFERELHDRLSRDQALRVVPQWPSRGKFIDLVITDRAGRRLAVEADGDQHHETVDGGLIPEDIYRQELLEEVGWVFHRVRYSDFVRDPDRQTEEILQRLTAQPPNEQLANEVWGEDAVRLPELEQLIAPTEAQAIAEPDDGSRGLVTLIIEEASTEPLEQTLLTREDLAQLKLDAPAEASAASGEAEENAPAADEPATSSQADDDLKGDGRDGDELLDYTQPKPLPLDPNAYAGAHLHDVPLALLPQQIAMVVVDCGGLSDEEVSDAYAERFGIEVPRNRRRLLTSFAWSASGRGFIAKDGDRWVPGAVLPYPIEHIGSWSMQQVEQLVGELVAEGLHEDDLFERALGIVWQSDHRVPRPITRAVGAAIYAVIGKRR